MENELSLRVTRLVKAAPERVFEAWLDPELLARFMRTAPQNGVKSAQVEPLEGGSFEIVMTTEAGEVPHWGSYREITRPSRLVFTWNSPHAAPDSLVTVTFAPDADGTMVTLEHVSFPSEASREGHRGGWTAILERLESALAG